MYLDFSLAALVSRAMCHGVDNKGHRVCDHVTPELMTSTLVQLVCDRKASVGPARGCVLENLDHRLAILVWHELVLCARTEQKMFASHPALQDRP